MNVKFGNLTVEQFSERVGATFTDDEIESLKEMWSSSETLTGPDQFHIFDDPALSIHIGSRLARCLAIFTESDDRKTWNAEVSFYVDRQWAL